MSATPLEAKKPYQLWDLIRYFLNLGSTGFGGPVALVGYMHRDLVEKRQWISEADYDEGLALAQLAPGPLAAQLAIYMGYVHYGVLGATLVGLAFIIPSFFMVVALAVAYVNFGGLAWVQAVFYGIGACIIGIIAQSAYRLTKRTIGTDKLLWAIYLCSALVTYVTQTENIVLFILAGLIVWLVKAPPMRFKHSTLMSLPLPFFAQVAPSSLISMNGDLWQIFLFFSKAGAFVFGSGLAIVPFLYTGVVKEFAWLNQTQFLDAMAIAMISPGPVVVTVAFIGYLVAGFPGATIAALATYLPCYLFTIIPAPYFKKYGKLPAIIAFVEGITAAAIGALSGAVVIIASQSIKDIPTLLIALATIGILWKTKKIPEPVLILIAALLGLVLHPLVV